MSTGHYAFKDQVKAVIVTRQVWWQNKCT